MARTSAGNTARLRIIVGWVKRSETQQIPSNSWVSLPQPNLPHLWLAVGREEFRSELPNSVLKDWTWWINWMTLKAFLARQQRERHKWLERVQAILLG